MESTKTSLCPRFQTVSHRACFILVPFVIGQDRAFDANADLRLLDICTYISAARSVIYSIHFGKVSCSRMYARLRLVIFFRNAQYFSTVNL